MSSDQVKETPNDITLTTPRNRKIRRYGAQVLCVAVALMAAAAVWVQTEHRDTRRLGTDTRVVVRFPKAVFSELTRNEIREEFPILESSERMQITGDAVATGRVSIDIEPDSDCGSECHAIIAVHVNGETTKSLVGEQASTRILGTGRGQFDAVKRIHFDGREFRAAGETEVTATHETEIDDVETAVGGPIRLLASRKARQAIPLVNELAVKRIQERVGARLDELVASTLSELNLFNRFDDTIAALHPSSENWRIQVTTDNDTVQAALIPSGGQVPQLPRSESSVVEVWMRLTATQKLEMRLLNRWKQSYRMLSGIVPEDQSKKLAKGMSVSDVDGWTRLQLATNSLTGDNA